VPVPAGGQAFAVRDGGVVLRPHAARRAAAIFREGRASATGVKIIVRPPPAAIAGPRRLDHPQHVHDPLRPAPARLFNPVWRATRPRPSGPHP
jgi:hypothetical protein